MEEGTLSNVRGKTSSYFILFKNNSVRKTKTHPRVTLQGGTLKVGTQGDGSVSHVPAR